MFVNLLKDALLSQLRLPSIGFFRRNSLASKTNGVSNRMLYGTLAGVSFLLAAPTGNIFGMGACVFFTYKCIRSWNEKKEVEKPSIFNVLKNRIKETFENLVKKPVQDSPGTIHMPPRPRLYPTLD